MIRPMGASELDAVSEIAGHSMQAPWSFDQFFSEVQFARGVRLVAEVDTLCGYVIFRYTSQEAELLQLAVLPRFRRQGVATSLLSAGIQHLQLQHVEECFLEVRKRNQEGRCFYTQAGFQQVGLRKKYYSRPVDDAVIMKLLIEKGKGK